MRRKKKEKNNNNNNNNNNKKYCNMPDTYTMNVTTKNHTMVGLCHGQNDWQNCSTKYLLLQNSPYVVIQYYSSNNVIIVCHTLFGNNSSTTDLICSRAHGTLTIS